MQTTERLAFETEIINHALQHDIVLYGTATADSSLTLTWRTASGCISPRFDDRDLAINWMVDWLAYDTPAGDR